MSEKAMMRRFFLVTVMVLTVSGCTSYSGTTRPAPRQHINIFNPDGSRAGYGYIQNGEVELFRPDGTRWIQGGMKQ